MRRSRSPVSSSSLLLLLLVAVLVGLVRGADLSDEIYTYLDNSIPCTRLLHKTGAIGCATPRKGWIGTLRSIQTPSDLDALIASSAGSSGERLALVVPITMFNRATMNRIRDSSLEIAGIMLMKTSPQQIPRAGYSPQLATPDCHQPTNSTPWFKPESTPYCTSVHSAGKEYAWNSVGDGLSMERYDYAMIAMDTSETQTVLAKAQLNEQSISRGEYPGYAAEFQYQMFASLHPQYTPSSQQCLADSYCMPVGGYSVWSTYGSWCDGSNATKSGEQDWILAATTLDGVAQFHDAAQSVEAMASGYLVWFGAQIALAQVPGIGASSSSDASTAGEGDWDPNLNGGLTKRIVWAAFAGERWSHVGSRKFVDDLLHFQCDQFDGNGGCSQPFKPSLAFQGLNFNRLVRALDFSQLGLNSSNYLTAHRPKTWVSPETDRFIADLQRVANQTTMSGNQPVVAVGLADADTPGIPSSPLMAFTEPIRPTTGGGGANEQRVPVVVLSDHSGAYANKYWGSEFDTAETIPGATTPVEPPVADQGTGGPTPTVWSQQLCTLATFTARALYVSAGGSLANSTAFIPSANCTLLAILADCFTANGACSYVTQYLGGSSGFLSGNTDNVWTGTGPGTRYASVYQLMLRQYLGGLSAFTELALEDAGSNGTVIGITHDAVDPALVFDYNQGMWTVVGDLTQTQLWTESNWKASIWTRIFRRESPRAELTLLIAGLSLVAVSIVVTYSVRHCCVRHFKTV